jgi:hypothetical protein
MYVGVPTAMPVRVSLSPPATLTARAMPKSATSARPLERRMFSGLMSRWMTLFECANASASAICFVRSIASSIDSCFSRSSLSRSDAPSTKGMV